MHPYSSTPSSPAALLDGELNPHLVALFQLLGYPCQPTTSLAELVTWTAAWAEGGPYPTIAKPHKVRSLLGNMGFMNSPQPNRQWYGNIVLLARTVAEVEQALRTLRHHLDHGVEARDVWYVSPDWYFDSHHLLLSGINTGSLQAITETWTTGTPAGLQPQFIHPRPGKKKTPPQDLLWKLRLHMGFTPGHTLLIAPQPLLPARHLAAARILRVGIDPVGFHPAPPTPPAKQGLEGLARWLHELILTNAFLG